MSDVSIKVKLAIEKGLKNVERQVLSRGMRASNAIRNAELEVLKGQRSGRVYRKPHTRSATYRASAPGEPPAVRTGHLRLSFMPKVETSARTGKGIEISPGIESGVHYAPLLENGTSRMARRPYEERIKEKAFPEVKRIFEEPYF